MAIIITDECINCGACEPECPNTAIYEGAEDWKYADDKCTECKGFHDEPQCAAVCPVDCCVPDDDNVETEEELLAKQKFMHNE
ncbi:UNVERIFIED_CONTAM: hypothetical protein GTU68_048560 [Idotea baltica]|nr:hypothetical protein [Idotea baltica]